MRRWAMNIYIYILMALVEKLQNVKNHPDVPKSKDIKMPQTLKRKEESWSCCQVNVESSAIGVRWKHTKCKKMSILILTKHVKTEKHVTRTLSPPCTLSEAAWLTTTRTRGAVLLSSLEMNSFYELDKNLQIVKSQPKYNS